MSLSPAMIETMAAAAYDANRPPRSHLPAWKDATEHYRECIRREVRAAIKAGVAAGYLIVGVDQ